MAGAAAVGAAAAYGNFSLFLFLIKELVMIGKTKTPQSELAF